MVQQDLVNVLANIHNKARETIALQCTGATIFKILGYNLLQSLDVDIDIPTTKDMVNTLMAQQSALESRATLSYLLIPNKPNISKPKKLSFWKRIFTTSDNDKE